VELKDISMDYIRSEMYREICEETGIEERTAN
jgi:hypothetical protein